MGAWGTEIFSDDLAADIRREYNVLLALKPEEVAEALLIDYYADMLGREDENEPVFWFALALAEWNKGRLSEKTRSMALYYLEQGGDLERWNTPGNQKNYSKRKKVLSELKKKLLGEQPEKKKIRKPTVHHSPWKVGSLLAYRMITDPESAQKSLHGKYILLRIIGIKKWPVSRIIPEACYDETILVGLYGWCGDKCPDPEIVQDLNYIPFDEYQLNLPGMIDFARLREEGIKNIGDVITNISSWEVVTCCYLNWIPKRGDPVDIQCIGCDSSYERVTPAFFNEGKKKCIFINLYALEEQLMEKMKPYYKSSEA